jgi:hypothetical protein
VALLRDEVNPMVSKYAGVTLDWYDDHGATLKAMFPSVDLLPDFIKEADVRPMEKLANEDFALVALDSGTVMRKFACHDPGTTAMSVIYFMEHGDKLPDAAQKLAAANLVEACQRFDLAPPALMQKMAGLDPGKLQYLKSMAVPAAIGATFGGIHGSRIDDEHRVRNTLLGAGMGGLLGATVEKAFPSAESSGSRLENVVQQAARGVTGGNIGGLATKGAFQGDKQRKAYDEAMAKKTAGIKERLAPAAERLAGGMGRAEEAMRGWAKKSPSKGSQLGAAGLIGGSTMLGASAMHKKASVVDITGKLPTPAVKVASSSNPDDYAVVLPDGSRHYPIHTWDLVKKAEVYYQDEHGRMQPEIRRQYAVKLASRAVSMGYPLDPEILEAGATDWAPKGHLKAAVEMRKIACQPGESRQFLDELFEKRSSMEPETYAEVLRRFDVQNGLDKGWDQLVLDPWASTFSAVKTAEVVWEDGADRVTDDELVNLATNHLKRMRQVLTESMCKEFVKDPIGIFESMPMPQKRIISRLASDHREYSDVTDNEKSASWVEKALQPHEIEQLGGILRRGYQGLKEAPKVAKRSPAEIMGQIQKFKSMGAPPAYRAAV